MFIVYMYTYDLHDTETFAHIYIYLYTGTHGQSRCLHTGKWYTTI